MLIDEVPEVVTELASTSKRKALWNETVKIFGSGGAKVNINVILLSQSPNIEDVGMNAKMCENFTTIAMANLAKPFSDTYEKDKNRRKELIGLVVAHSALGMKPAELPAAAEYGGTVHVLSRDGILAHRETVIEAEVWTPRKQLPSGQPSTPAHDPLLSGLLHQAATRYDATKAPETVESRVSQRSVARSKDDVEELIRDWFSIGMTHREVRENLNGLGLEMAQNQFPRLQREGLARNKH